VLEHQCLFFGRRSEGVGGDVLDNGQRRLKSLTEAASLQLLGSVSVGRVVFSHGALPTARPVNHLVDKGHIIVRTHLGAALRSVVGQVVTYEVDAIDEQQRVGWSVLVTGYARLVEDPDEITRYQQALRSWLSGELDQVIRIQPEIVTGYELVDGLGAESEPPGPLD
jgi:hypothetical protein